MKQIVRTIQGFAERSIHRGKRFVVLVFGVFGFGGVMFLLTTLLSYEHNPTEFMEKAEIYKLVLSAVVWGVFGYLQGIFMWRYVLKINSR
jgi:hypothetical protein